MAGFLSDLGRSNAIQSVNNLSNTAVQLKGLQDRDEQQGFENAINLEKLGMMRNEQDVDLRIKTAQANEAEEKAKAMTMPYDITMDPRFLALPPESQKVVMDHAVKNKYTDQNGIGTRRSALQLLSDTEGKSELFTSAMGPVVEIRKKAVTESWSALQDAKVKGDPKKIQEAQSEFDKASLTYQSTQAGFSNHLSALEKERAKQEGRIEKGPGGGLYRHKEDGTLEELIPPPPKEEKTFKEGDTRQYEKGDKKITEEFRGGKWEPLATAPRSKPDSSGGVSFADREAIRSMGKNLPKAKALAETAAKNIQKIDRMIELVNRGAGGVKGDLIAKINKVADVFRNTSPEDAKYNTLKSELRGMAGQLRLQLGLVGQTSDRDVQIMYEAAGGGTPAESQKALFEGYKQGYMWDITNYNSDVEAYAGYSKAGKSLYRPVSVPSKAAGPQVVEERTLPNGEVWQSLSDGTYRKVK